jgi:hypothetical protein
MLTGWDLKVPCNDIKVRDNGVWIKEWDYDPTNPGKLHYVLSWAGEGFQRIRHKVTVLGLRPAPLPRGVSPLAKE